MKASLRARKYRRVCSWCGYSKPLGTVNSHTPQISSHSCPECAQEGLELQEEVLEITGNQVELLELLASGKYYKEISAHYKLKLNSHCQPMAVEGRVKRLRKRLGARTNERLIYIACKMKILN